MKIKCIFCGDVHDQFLSIENLANHEQPDIIIQVGDFGIWPNKHGTYDHIKINSSIPVYFCRGNHENHDLLDTFPPFEITNLKSGNRLVNLDAHLEARHINKEKMKKLSMIPFPRASNIYLCESGSILSLGSNTNILFIGGAASIDQHHRHIGKSWWPQETMWKYQIEYILNLLENHPTIDIIVSHTAPKFVVEDMFDYDISGTFQDPTCSLLEHIYHELMPKKWFFGHFHKFYEKIYDQTEFVGLNMCDPSRNGKYNNTFFKCLIID